MLFVFLSFDVLAETAEELRQKIDNAQDEISNLDAQIEKLNKELNQIEGEKDTLKNELKRIQISGKSIEAKIKKTIQQISATQSNIAKTEKEIGYKELDIDNSKNVLNNSIRLVNNQEGSSILEIILSGKTISSFFKMIDDLQRLQASVSKALLQLEQDRVDLGNKKSELIRQKNNMLILQETLKDEKKLNDQLKSEKDALLRETQNKESNYINLIEEIKKKREQFEKELFDYESKLKIIIDPNSYPSPGTRVFSWPLDKIYITQYFGNTEFARSNTQAYAGLGHNGIDLRASVGTRVIAPLGGIVRGTGDTDLACKRASYGRWVLIDHGNGLSTLFAHLSLVKVGAGQKVDSGDVIAYSGNTGYSTGPHLHFSVFATKGVEIGQLASRVRGCGIYTLPRASFNAYLNPLSYLDYN